MQQLFAAKELFFLTIKVSKTCLIDLGYKIYHVDKHNMNYWKKILFKKSSALLLALSKKVLLL